MPARRVLREPRDLGAIIRDERKARGMSQEELADWAGLHRTYLSGIESGKSNPHLRLVLPLLNALGLDLVVERRAADDA